MRKFRKIAVTCAAVGLAAFGAVAASGGTANAVGAEGITGCSTNSALLFIGTTPNCTASPGRIYNPVAITYVVNPSFFEASPGPVIVNSTLECMTNGTIVTAATPTFTATLGNASQTLDLQTLVGSPSPSWCDVVNLTATAPPLITPPPVGTTFGVTAFGINLTPGAIYQDEGRSSNGAVATACVDDTGNGNTGTPAQGWPCLADAGQGWEVLPSGQIVHNGDCLQDSAGTITLQVCNGSTRQTWTVTGAGGTFEAIVNRDTGNCLTNLIPAPGHHLVGTTCVDGAADQLWTAPATTVVG